MVCRTGRPEVTSPGPDVRLGVMIVSTFAGFERFRAEMRAQQIHIGLSYAGDDVHCATCDEAWPCSSAQGQSA